MGLPPAPTQILSSLLSRFRKSLDKDGVVGRISKGGAEPLQGCIKTSVEFHVSVGRPKILAQLLTRYDLSSALQKNGEKTEWLILQPDAHTWRISSPLAESDSNRPNRYLRSELTGGCIANGGERACVV